MEAEVLRPMDKETEKGKRKAQREIKLVKLEFDLRTDRDRELYQQLKNCEQKINATGASTKIKIAELIKLAIPKLTDVELLELKMNSLSKKDRLTIWAQNFNKDNGTSYSIEEFAVDILPTLSGKDLKRVQEINL